MLQSAIQRENSNYGDAGVLYPDMCLPPAEEKTLDKIRRNVVRANFVFLKQESNNVITALQRAISQDNKWRSKSDEVPLMVLSPVKTFIKKYIKLIKERNPLIVEEEFKNKIKIPLTHMLKENDYSEEDFEYASTLIRNIFKSFHDIVKEIVNDME